MKSISPQKMRLIGANIVIIIRIKREIPPKISSVIFIPKIIIQGNVITSGMSSFIITVTIN